MPHTTAPAVAALVINWNGIEQTRGCVQSLLRTTYPVLRICVVDNGSADNEAAVLSAEFPSIDTLRLPDNLGYPAACNAGVHWARHAGIGHACILNNDTSVAPDFFDALVAKYRELGPAAILAPMILRPDGNVWSAGGLIDWPNVAGRHIGEGGRPHEFASDRTVDWASGCALFFSLDAFDRAGPMDERFFLYLEDIEWCMRARRRGLQVWYTPSARINHEVNKTVRRFDPRIGRYYAYRNFYLLGFKHASLPWRAWFGAHLLFSLSKVLVRNAISPAHRHDGVYNARTRALLDFLRGRFGKAPYEHRLDARSEVKA